MDFNFESNARAFTYLSGGKGDASADDKRPSFGDSFVLVYICKGRGKITIGSNEHLVKSGESFLVFPHITFAMKADSEDPWEYRWIEIKGSLATWLIEQTAFRKDSPVVGVFPDIGIEEMFDINSENSNTLYEICRINGKIFMLLSYYMEYFPCVAEKSTDYVFLAREYIQKNYRDPECTVKKVAYYIKIDRTYLYRLFKNETGMSVIEYLNKCRVSEASILLVDDNVSIKDVAYYVGFTDQMYFSRVFKRVTGHTPTEYRRLIKTPYKFKPWVKDSERPNKNIT